jgi:ubiquinone/menaquinone biosynthesis C-methylase UbiE
MTVAAENLHPAGRAFDAIAKVYDSLFTTSLIGRSQRAAVWRKAETVFRPGDRVLELNCGTGEDALFLARRGVAVYACDASGEMIAQARARKAIEAPSAEVEFNVLCTESLENLSGECFDGIFSNFSGLNCVENLARTARELAMLVHPGSQLLFCLSTRFCVWETLHYLLRGEVRKCFRRLSGIAQSSLGGYPVTIYYPTLGSVLKSFRPTFQLRSVTGIGVAVPPSYLEAWAQRNEYTFHLCEAADRVLCHTPGVRVLGDHMLLHLERA